MGFMTNFNDWEIYGVDSFLHLLESYIPTREGEDQMRCKLRRNGDFTVRSFYETFGVHLLCLSLGKPYRGLWLLIEFPFVVWTAAWGKILTCDNLIKRGYAMVSWCCMCRCNGEIVVHLLIHFDTLQCGF